MGYIKDATGSFNGGLWCLAACGLVSMGIVLALRHDSKLEEAPNVRSALPAE
jgi:ACS family tartrate transporter-like MFS transporter